MSTTSSKRGEDYHVDALPTSHLPTPVVVCINAISHALNEYDAKRIWPSECAYKVIGTILVLTARERGIVLEYFRKCGQMRPRKAIKRATTDAKRNLQTKA